MTKEEAINWLNTEDYESMGFKKALAKAIEVLGQDPCEDCISRKAVLDGQITRYGADGIYSHRVVPVDYINNLPSITPITCAACTLHMNEEDLIEIANKAIKEKSTND